MNADKTICFQSGFISVHQRLTRVVDGKHEGNRIYSAMTADFANFTMPAIFFDPGYEVIDATIPRDGSKYYLVFKDERKESRSHGRRGLGR